MTDRLITTAAHQYATRPADERLPSVDAFVSAALADKNHSVERTYPVAELRAVPNGRDVRLVSPAGAEATFTHWSFGQLARSVGAPAGYLRSLSPSLAADCLNEGFQTAAAGTRANVLLRTANGVPEPIIRAATSETYGRVWDCELASDAARHVFQYRGADGHEWQNAPTWAGDSIAGFRSDRDSFLLQIDGGSIVEDPSLRQGGHDARMFRGVMIRNSEVGAASVSIEVVLFRFVCGNWNLWGATMGRQFRRRHVGRDVVRDTVRELAQVARAFTTRPASADVAIIQTLIDRQIATTKDGVVDELRALGATRDQALAAYAQAEQHEAAAPVSYWGIAQGLTRASQDTAYTDDRYALDRLAAVVLARGTKVAA